MAKRKGFRYRTKTIYKKSRGGGGGFKPLIDGALAGALGQIASKWLGAYGHPAATVIIGMWRNNTTLKTEGARELGAQLAAQLPIIGGESPYSGVY